LLSAFYSTADEDVNSFAADFLAPSAGKNIYVREIKLQSLTFVNRAITVTNGTEGVLSTLVANGSERVNKISFLTFLKKKLQRFCELKKKTLRTVPCQLANYALETLGERKFCYWNGVECVRG